MACIDCMGAISWEWPTLEEVRAGVEVGGVEGYKILSGTS